METDKFLLNSPYRSGIPFTSCRCLRSCEMISSFLTSCSARPASQCSKIHNY